VTTITSSMTAGKAFTVGTNPVAATTVTGALTTAGFGMCTPAGITASSIPTGSYTCGTVVIPPGATSAPIFSTKEKAAVFGQEVK